MKSCSIIIPVFNQLDFTRQCLDSIFAHAQDFPAFEVVVVNNASSDGTKAYLESLASKVRALHLEKNMGFSYACNAGTKIARNEQLIFLNNDTQVEKFWLHELMLRVDSYADRLGALGSKLVYVSDRTINHVGYVFNPMIGHFYSIYHALDPEMPAANKEREYQAFLGACLLVPRRLFEQVGGFSDFGLEDIDLCLKLRRAGYKVVYVPTSKVLHHGSVTLKNSPLGSIAPMDSTQFNQAWPSESLLWDDLGYYHQDGFTATWDKTGHISLQDVLCHELIDKTQEVRMRCSVEPDKAEHILRAELQSCSSNQDLYLDLVCVLVESGQMREALSACLELLKLDQESYRALYWLFQLYNVLQMSEEKATILKKLLTLKGLSSKQIEDLAKL